MGLGTVELMRRVKNAVDPHHIMNPGKVILIVFSVRTLPTSP